jgi:hypothetical protein
MVAHFFNAVSDRLGTRELAERECCGSCLEATSGQDWLALFWWGFTRVYGKRDALTTVVLRPGPGAATRDLKPLSTVHVLH